MSTLYVEPIQKSTVIQRYFEQIRACVDLYAATDFVLSANAPMLADVLAEIMCYQGGLVL